MEIPIKDYCNIKEFFNFDYAMREGINEKNVLILLHLYEVIIMEENGDNIFCSEVKGVCHLDNRLLLK